MLNIKKLKYSTNELEALRQILLMGFNHYINADERSLTDEEMTEITQFIYNNVADIDYYVQKNDKLEVIMMITDEDFLHNSKIKKLLSNSI